MVDADRYAYRVHWSGDDAAFIATAAEFPSLSWVEDTPTAALAGMVRLAHEVVSEMEDSGETPPEPVATRDYSGRFVVRIPPETHRDLAIDAAEQGVSLNALALSRLVAA
ncbi:MAG: type II toxin-antitoxin system HicB family antitoxin [Propionibacteriaceae bacterium]|jgi:predicted HicB family RNase H-like nuclease|nr:type II toxin-antitoxin system HicB family antitoxin [Propionibacteriaceae bacterium]